MPIELTVDQRALQALARAARAESDGKALRRDLIRTLRAPADAVVSEIQAGVMSAPGGGSHAGVPLRSTVARNIRSEVRLSGRNTGVRIRAKRTPGVRGFAQAPKRLNSPKGWRHRVFGRDVWTVQYGKPQYFDDPPKAHRAEFRAAVVTAMRAMAERIAARSKVG